MSELAGSQFSPRANIAMRMSPVTNSGRPMNAREVIEITWSKAFPRRRAETSPRRIPSGTYMRKATRASMPELRSLAATSGKTGSLVDREVPQSPCT